MRREQVLVLLGKFWVGLLWCKGEPEESAAAQGMKSSLT